jgi:NTE family protein
MNKPTRKAPSKKAKPASKKHVKPLFRLNLALQGGGAHGAFTWGVLDRLLEEEDIEIAGISGTSAGAMNAAVLVDGYHEGGRARAKAQLREFWYEISAEAGKISPFGQQEVPEFITQWPGLEWISALNPFDMMSRVFSPYETNPLNYNPLRNVLERLLKNKHLQNGIPLFITATSVETGEARVFREEEVTIDVLLASACLPFVYQAVEVEGKPYWDGGYMGNPAIWPLIYNTECPDVLLVQINPILRAGTPKSAMDIINRVNEISFNSSLIAEMRAINFVRKLIKEGKLSKEEYTDMRMHRVTPPQDLHAMNASSKMNASWEFFQLLHEIGRGQMDEWLKTHKTAIGKRCSLDIEEHFLEKHTKPRSTRKKVLA